MSSALTTLCTVPSVRPFVKGRIRGRWWEALAKSPRPARGIAKTAPAADKRVCPHAGPIKGLRLSAGKNYYNFYKLIPFATANN